MTITILTGCCISLLGSFPDRSVNTCVTSPPYYGLRDYGVSGQIGLEPTPEEYVATMIKVFKEVRRVLKDDGTMWLNIGDSYNAAGRKGHGTRIGFKQGTNRASATGADHVRPSVEGLKPKDLIGIPWMLAFALRSDGWHLRQDIIWYKPNAMPESVKDRCTKSHEYVFLLSKCERYYFDHESVKEQAVKGAAGSSFYSGKIATHQLGRASDKERIVDGKRSRRSVWSVPTKPLPEGHFATYPPELIEPCILAGCPEGGTVLDPFFGSGTTGLVADRLRRDCIGIELNPDYASIARKRINNELGMFADTTLGAA